MKGEGRKTKDERVQREEAKAFWVAKSAMRNAMNSSERHSFMKHNRATVRTVDGRGNQIHLRGGTTATRLD